MSFTNSKKDKYLSDFPIVSIEELTDKLTAKSKFNFSYMDFSQSAGQKFVDWNHDQLSKLLDKLYQYSKEPLGYWRNQRIGSGGNKVLVVYKNFPNKSKFTQPKHIPHQASWARFRLEYKVRLIGFVIPTEFNNHQHPVTKIYYDCNTFYVVFLDANHQFYITEDA